MKKSLPAVACTLLLSLSQQFSIDVRAQDLPKKAFPSDSSLLRLVDKFVRTPIRKSLKPGGEVFLQRDMSAYLRTHLETVPVVEKAQQDYGDQQDDSQLRDFLNRPHPDVATMKRYFADAANEFDVPLSILKATAQVQSNWAQVSASLYGSWGVMGIIENKFIQQITEAAQLLKVKPEEIKTEAKTNIRAAAALLAFYQNDKPARAKIEDWFESVKSLTGLPSIAIRSHGCRQARSTTSHHSFTGRSLAHRITMPYPDGGMTRVSPTTGMSIPALRCTR